MSRKAKATKSTTGTGRRVTDAHTALGQKLRAARLQAGMSQEDVAKTLGLSFQQVQKYEKGVNRIDVNRLVQCAKLFNVQLDFFTGSIAIKRDDGAIEFDAILASREGVQIIEAMVEMSPSQRQFLIDIARKLPHLAAA